MSDIAKHSDEPIDLRAAPTHPNPFSFYRRLAQSAGLVHDPSLGAWIASDSNTVREVLEHPLCHTRPNQSSIPRRLQGPMGELFVRLVRLREGPEHATLKYAVRYAIAKLDLTDVARVARAHALRIEPDSPQPIDVDGVTRFIYALPIQMIAQLLGIGEDLFDNVANWLTDYDTATFAVLTRIPPPDDALLARGHEGARQLMELMRALLRGPAPGPLLASLAAAVTHRPNALDETDICANGVGYLAQGYSAIAAAVGLSLLALARRPELVERATADRAARLALIHEALRLDPTTCVTARFVVEDIVIRGQAVRAGEMIIVVIASANRDPALNLNPDQFDLNRDARRSLEFGAGAHACPANSLAPMLAEVALAHLLDRKVPLEALAAHVEYAPSAFIRTPRFVTRA